MMYFFLFSAVFAESLNDKSVDIHSQANISVTKTDANSQTKQNITTQINAFPNFGNSCYMNASLQLLLQPKTLKKHVESINSSEHNIILITLNKILTSYNNDDQALFLNNLLYFFCYTSTSFFGSNSINKQHDSREFIIKLINSIQFFKDSFSFSTGNTISCDVCQQSTNKSNNITKYDLTIKTPQEINTVYSLQELLNLSFVTDNIKCPYCASPNGTLITQLNDYPDNILIICKNSATHQIQFPITNLILDKSNNKKYNLSGLILYSKAGTIGHYVSLIKSASNNDWYICDDNCVLNIRHIEQTIEQIAENGILYDFSPYIFLYSKNRKEVIDEKIINKQ